MVIWSRKPSTKPRRQVCGAFQLFFLSTVLKYQFTKDVEASRSSLDNTFGFISQQGYLRLTRSTKLFDLQLSKTIYWIVTNCFSCHQAWWAISRSFIHTMILPLNVHPGLPCCSLCKGYPHQCARPQIRVGVTKSLNESNIIPHKQCDHWHWGMDRWQDPAKQKNRLFWRQPCWIINSPTQHCHLESQNNFRRTLKVRHVWYFCQQWGGPPFTVRR